MKRAFVAIFSLAVAAALAEDASTFRLAARQRWPFSRVVDIDIVLNGANCRDVDLTATYDGAAEPLNLVNGLIDGSPTLLPGINHLVWDPAAAGLGSANLKGFTVLASLEAFDARKYLVIDLKERNYAYYADDPEGNNWSDDKYKLRYVVFRRVPAGIYQLGYSDEQRARWKSLGSLSGGYPVNSTMRTVTITRDYYIAIYMLTVGQAIAISWHSETGNGGVNGYYYSDTSVTEKAPQKYAPKGMRGDFGDRSLGCTWPQNGHSVAMPECAQSVGKTSGSVIGRFRQLMKNGNNDLPSNMTIDLPTEAQWEVAARAGTTTFYADCGTLTDTADAILEYQNTHSTNRNVNVGLMLPNSWGLYDAAGIAYEMTLNVVTSTTNKDFTDDEQCWVEGQTVDPVGIEVDDSHPIFAVCCNCGWSSRGISWGALPSSRRAYVPSSADPVGVRLAIHLAPLIK